MKHKYSWIKMRPTYKTRVTEGSAWHDQMRRGLIYVPPPSFVNNTGVYIFAYMFCCYILQACSYTLFTNYEEARRHTSCPHQITSWKPLCDDEVEYTKWTLYLFMLPTTWLREGSCVARKRCAISFRRRRRRFPRGRMMGNPKKE